MTSVLLLTRHPHAMIQAMGLARTRLIARIADTARQPDARFANAFARLIVAVESAFRHEEQLMEMEGYPGLRDERRNNALLLGALHHAASQVDSGNIATGREVAAALPGLLSMHRFSALRMLSRDMRGRRADVVKRHGRLRAHAGSRRRSEEGRR